MQAGPSGSPEPELREVSTLHRVPVVRWLEYAGVQSRVGALKLRIRSAASQ